MSSTGDSGPALLDFPCRYTVKVLGRETPDFGEWVAAQIEAHGPICIELELRPSAKGRFVSVNATFIAESLDQLQLIHGQLRASERVTLIL